MNASHIWIGGGFITKNREDYFEEKTEVRKVNGTTLDKTWFFDGSSWIPIKSMMEKRNKAACSIVLDQDGEVAYFIKTAHKKYQDKKK